MSRPRPSTDWSLRLAIAASLVVVGTLGLRASFDSWTFLVPAGIGVAVSTVVAFVGKSRRLLFGETLALSLVAFGVGGVLLGGSPDPTAFVTGLTAGWSDLLTSSPPAELTPTLRVIPYAIGWLGGAISGELQRRDAAPVLAAGGALVALVVTLLVSLEDRSVATAQGAVLATGAVMLGFVAKLFGQDAWPAVAGTRRQALAFGSVMLIAILMLSSYVGPRLPFAGSRDRFDLRQFQDRPWNPLEEPSPLVTMKAALKAGQDETEVFRVQSDTPIERFTLATLSSYGGSVWSVADEVGDGPDGAAASRFTPVDARFPKPDISAGEQVSFELEMLASSSPWLPLAGWPREVKRVGSADTDRLRFNSETGTVADPSGFRSGERFDIVSGQMPDISLQELEQLTVVSIRGQDTDLGLIPPALVNVAGDVFEGSDRGSAHVVALAETFSTTGFYDATDAARPGHSLARLSEFFADGDRLVGYEEQFAAGAGVLLRIDDVSTRVAVGYVVPADRYIDGVATIVGGDLSAWVEVETVEVGWVPVDVTPDRAREPEAETAGRSIQDVAVPNPPPPPAPLPEVQPPSQPEISEDEADEPDGDETEAGARFTPNRWVVAFSIGLLAPPALLVLAGLVIVGLKRRRRRIRQHSPDRRDCVAGAWREVCDRLTEVGIVPRPTTTPHEVTSAALTALDDDQHVNGEIATPLHRLANAADRAAFHPAEPDAAAVSAAWDDYESAATCLRGTRTLSRRVLNISDPASLRRQKRSSTREDTHA